MTQDPNQPGGEGYESEGYTPSEQPYVSTGAASGFDEREDADLNQTAPAVAAPQSRIIIILLGVVVVVVIVLFMLFSGDDGPTEEELAAAAQNVQVAAPVETPQPLPEPPTPTEPTTPEADQAQLPPLPLPPEEMVPPDMPDIAPAPVDSEALLEQRRAEEELRTRRLRSGMTLSGGAASGLAGALSGGSQNRISSAEAGPRDNNSTFARMAESEPVAVVQAERMPDSRITIAQGKMVNVVLESAINTDMPAPIRAIVSRDTYAEAGKNIMIPKGSRVIGRYNTDVFRGQKRIFIIWTRVIRPDGTSIAIGSPGVDQIGRAGAEGIVDNKYLEVYSTAILTSMLTIGAAVGADHVVDGEVSTSNNALGGSTTTGSAGATAVQQSITDLGNTTQQVVSSVVNLRPTITLDQGTRMNIFVNRDLTFPNDVQGGPTMVLQ